MKSVTFFTSLEGGAPRYAAVARSKKWSLRVRPMRDVRRWSSEAEIEICYLDLTEQTRSESDSLIRSARRKRDGALRFGIVDPNGIVSDPARLFHEGFVDYLGPELADSALTPKRLDAVYEFVSSTAGSAQPADVKSDARQCGRGASARVSTVEEASRPAAAVAPAAPAAPEGWHKTSEPPNVEAVSGWEEIEPSNEYTFWMMYVEIDDSESYRKASSDTVATGVFDSFRRVVERYAGDFRGRLWMWKETGGVLLFPFDGHSQGAIVTAMRLVLNRTIINVEDVPIQGQFSFHVALHVGNTLYEQKGDTGTIVSDAVNLLFHLGQRYTEPGTLTITEQAAHFGSSGLVPYFASMGVFEGTHIYRLRTPVRAESLAAASV